ncbi:hypothetical protein [Kribbella shirazensis]|uniref:Uncharacterized protein n=1 Tax=Kribbella shirazensis TaxID=1105143 RepID=A0A7X5VJQ6_9ACTN|nr:hypothetical protein [Kribbella shirazensis]NIK62499.1 hypothetical protein [Kribbella shirazensis]
MTVQSEVPSSRARQGARFLVRRWPTAIAAIAGVNTFFDDVTDGLVRSLAEAMLLLPTLYVIVAAVGRRRVTWLVLIGLLVGYTGLRLQDQVEPSIVVLAVALAAAILGAARGRLPQNDFRIQLLGMVAFGVLSFAGQLASPDLARYVVAAGWLAHGIWDIVYLIKDRLVSRSWAEWCAVVDILIAAGLILGA